MVIITPKKTWLLHFYYNKTMVNFFKGNVLKNICAEFTNWTLHFILNCVFAENNGKDKYGFHFGVFSVTKAYSFYFHSVHVVQIGQL